MLVAMSTQLLAGQSPGPKDANPFIDAAMAQVSKYCIGRLSAFFILHTSSFVNLQESSLVSLVVQRLLLNYMIWPRVPFGGASYPTSDDSQAGVLQRVGSAAGTVVWPC